MQQQSQNHLVKKRNLMTIYKHHGFNPKELSKKKLRYSFFESHEGKNLSHELLEKYILNSAFFSRTS